MPLTAREVQAAKPKDKLYGLADGGGLCLWVTPKGQRYWHFRYRVNGKQLRISLGIYPTISLQLAREQATEMRALVARGIDPNQNTRYNSTATRVSLILQNIQAAARSGKPLVINHCLACISRKATRRQLLPSQRPINSDFDIALVAFMVSPWNCSNSPCLPRQI